MSARVLIHDIRSLKNTEKVPLQMKRDLRLEDFTDGKLYHKNDMVKVGCDDCAGCSACCRNMGDSIVLDPYDIHQLTCHLHITFDTLLSEFLALHVVDGVILPSLKLQKKAASLSSGSAEGDAALLDEVCPFLNEEGRCSVHVFRPGLCRLFPLGRYYVEGSFHYILQNQECAKANKTKVKIDKWLGIRDLDAYEAFVRKWHYFLLDIEALLSTSEDETEKTTLNTYLLHTFYKKPYDENQFFTQFQERLENLKNILF